MKIESHLLGLFLLGNLCTYEQTILDGGFIKQSGNIILLSVMILGSNFPYKIPEKYKISNAMNFSASSHDHSARFRFADGIISPISTLNIKSVYAVNITYIL